MRAELLSGCTLPSIALTTYLGGPHFQCRNCSQTPGFCHFLGLKSVMPTGWKIYLLLFWLKAGCKERPALSMDVREEQLLTLSLQALGWPCLAEGLHLKWVWWQQTKSDLHCNKAHRSSALWKSNKIFNLNYLFKMLNRVETSQVVWSFHFSPGLCLWLHRYCSKALGKGWINYSIKFLWRSAGRLESKLRITMFPVLKLGPLIFRGRVLSIF